MAAVQRVMAVDGSLGIINVIGNCRAKTTLGSIRSIGDCVASLCPAAARGGTRRVARSVRLKSISQTI